MSQGPPPAAKPHSKAAVDRTPFYGYRVPNEIKELCKVLKTISQSAFRRILQLAVASIEGKPVAYVDLRAIEEKERLPQEGVSILYSGTLKALQLAVRCSASALSSEGLKEDLVGLGIQKEIADDLVVAVFGPRRATIQIAVMNNTPTLPNLKTLRWRIDVGISTSVLNRALEPAVLLDLELSDGNCRTIEMPVSKFHELRYNTAFVLKEMEDLEKRSILKIQD